MRLASPMRIMFETRDAPQAPEQPRTNRKIKRQRYGQSPTWNRRAENRVEST